MCRRRCGSWLVALLVATIPAVAKANGAFPDAQTVLTPADRPNDSLLVTNFGVVMSEDGGLSWQWACELADNGYGILYQLGPPPRRRLFTAAVDGLVFSDDRACGWQRAGGVLADQLVTDFFPDPNDGERVLAIGTAAGAFALFESRDAGTTFGAPLFAAPAGDAITGVEIARADPQTIYLAITTAGERRPHLARSTDGGAHFVDTDLTADLGAGVLRIAAVDARDPRTVWLRWIAGNDEALAVTRDGGATATKPVAITGTFTSFIALAGGTLLAAATIDAGVRPALYRSRDGGQRFDTVSSPPQIRALSERDGLVYAATENFSDGYALGVSSDEGTSWRAVMSYDQISAIVPCLRANAQCQATCEALVAAGAVRAATCAAGAPPPERGARGSGCAIGAPPLAVVSPFGLAWGALLLGRTVRRRRRRDRPPRASQPGEIPHERTI